MDGPPWSNIPILKPTNRRITPQSLILDKHYICELTRTRHNQTVLATQWNPSGVSRTSRILLTLLTHLPLTTTSTNLATEIAFMAKTTITPTRLLARLSVLPPPSPLYLSRCLRRTERPRLPHLHPQPGETQHQRRAQLPRQRNLSSVGLQMAKRTQRSVWVEDVDHYYQSNASKPARLESFGHAYDASS